MLTNLFELLKDYFYWIGNAIIQILANLINLAANLLPAMDLPIPDPDFVGWDVLSALNWVFPVSIGIHCMEAVLLSITLYFTLGIILRWAKVTN